MGGKKRKRQRQQSSAERRALKAELRVLMARGVPDQELADELDIQQRQLLLLRSELLSDEVTSIAGDTAGQAFVRYKLLREGLLDDLNDVIERNKDDAKGSGSIVAAIKVKATILDAIDEKGQQLGLIPRAPAPAEEFDGVNVDDLVEAKRNKLELLEQYEDDDDGDYADMEGKPLYG